MMKLRKTYKNFIFKQKEDFKKDFQLFMKTFYKKSFNYLSSPEIKIEDKKILVADMNFSKNFTNFLIFLSQKKHLFILQNLYKDFLLNEDLFQNREEIYKAGLRIYKDGAVLDLTPEGIINYLKVRL